jgi:acyl carrier protein
MTPIDVTDRLRRILDDSLQLGDKAGRLTAQSGLLGSIAEFDSMAVVTVLTMIEEEFGITVDDDEVSADVFETFGTLERFVVTKVNG